MASTLKNDEERNERIILVGEYVKNTGASTRKAAEYFTRTYFPISNATVSDYCARYLKMRPEEVDSLRGKINENTVKDLNSPEIAGRVLRNAELFLNGLTVNQIADITNSSFWTVYRDITKRLQILNPAMYEEVQGRLIDNSKGNLKNVK